jgi:predicted AAA+ superfamily ATPase
MVCLRVTRIDATRFFSEDYVTEGMRLLLTEVFKQLEIAVLGGHT